MILIPLVRTCYSGLVRGVVAECLSVAGLVSAAALACNYHEPLATTLAPWWRLSFTLLDFLAFLGLLTVGSWVLVRLVARALSRLISWNATHWVLQGAGMLCGGIRGMWMAGLALALLLATGVPYLGQSIQERSVFGPRLLGLSQRSLEWVANRFPGGANRTVLIPPLQ
ncbi:MAG: CvpA family protein [candidate division NC10 bacterium]